MAGPGALLPNTVPAPSSCWYRASTSRSLPHTAMSALVSAGVHDMPRQAAAGAPQDEAALRPPSPSPRPPDAAAPEPAALPGPSGEAPRGVEGSDSEGFPSLRPPGEAGESTSIFGILSGELAGRSEPQGAAIFLAAATAPPGSDATALPAAAVSGVALGPGSSAGAWPAVPAAGLRPSALRGLSPRARPRRPLLCRGEGRGGGAPKPRAEEKGGGMRAPLRGRSGASPLPLQPQPPRGRAPRGAAVKGYWTFALLCPRSAAFLQPGPGRTADVPVEAGDPPEVYPGRRQGWGASISGEALQSRCPVAFQETKAHYLKNSNSASNYDRFTSLSKWV